MLVGASRLTFGVAVSVAVYGPVPMTLTAATRTSYGVPLLRLVMVAVLEASEWVQSSQVVDVLALY